ncbi:Vegetative incompatibility protein HET-E-1 [Fusarium oxysporum]|uniref:Vegetative incompatibility protein HET-E-1 n=1 Tax=Fusarium oxysporum TaxID=5507 RepID=A0A420MBX7_FUSOX|nr:Vegetative incompatibility protein HET-E-1 [Fusarium oxysporum]
MQCLKHLFLTDPRADKKRIQDTKGGLLKDSYRWILRNDDFRRWRDDPRSRLLWIKGDPGKGKTMLLCGIIDELEKESPYRLSYFFCQATEDQLSNAAAVLRGLIYHLIIQQLSLISYVRVKYDVAGEKLFEGINVWVSLAEILTDMLNDPSLDGVTLIVDALDECTTNRQWLLDFIIKTSSRVKWIVSSRNWQDIHEKLDNTTQRVRLHLELSESSIFKAVHSYIRHKVDQLALEKHYDDELRGAVQHHLISNAHGTFLWVALVCQELSDPKVRKRHTLAKLKSFPPGLDSLYKRMMEYICDSYDADLCKKILAIASVVYRPVTLKELTSLVEPLQDLDDDLHEIIGSCGSFLTLRGEIVSFVHQSAKDFLLNQASDQILPSGITHQHHVIFSRSLEVLSRTLQRDIYSLRAPGFPIEQVSTPDPDPLASTRYSCIYWVDHLYDSEPAAKTREKDLGDGGVIHVFLQTKYLYWLEALSLLRSMSEGAMAMQKLRGLVRNVEVRELTELLRDAHRFILFHKRAIEIAPLQAYASALVFSPTHSRVRKLFKKEEPDWMISKPSVEANWNACLQTLEGHDHCVDSVAFSADSQWIASGSLDKTVKIWDACTGTCMRTLEGHGGSVLSIAFSADGRWITSGSCDMTAKIWDASTGACMRTLKGHGDSVLSVVFSADGQWIASGSYDKTVKIWDACTGTCVRTLEGHNHWVISVTFSADDRWIASGSLDKTVKIWDACTGTCVRTFEGHGDSVLSVVFSVDSQWIASGSLDKTVKIWDACTGACMRTLEGHGDSVLSVVFSADGQWIASGSYDKTVKVWDACTGACMRTFEGHGDSVLSVAFSADSQWIASGSLDKTVKIWDASTGACRQTLNVGRPMAHLWLDPMTNSCLSTDIGVLNLDLPSVKSQLTQPSLRDVSYSGYGISTDGVWVVKDEDVKLWLPLEYRASESAVVGSTVAIGCRSGCVLVMQFL